jgi:uncharacterized LabA/DUF88 family protein
MRRPVGIRNRPSTTGAARPIDSQHIPATQGRTTARCTLACVAVNRKKRLLPIHGIAAENRRSFTIEARSNLASTDTTRLAVLIDADNASASVAKELLEEVAKFGTATVKRAFGDWTTQNLVGWKAHLHRHAIQPIQQFAYTQGKNSTDSAFIIDAMALLYSGNVDGFCLVSSDSDFTRLATRLREAGKVVYGLGERKTPEPFIAACDKFIFFEVLKRPVEAAAPVQVPDVPDLGSC